MISKTPARRSGPGGVAATLMTACLATGCLTKSAPVTEPSPPPVQAPAPTQPAEPDPNIRRLEDRTRELELQILERDSQIQDLKARVASQQRRLDDAIQEVVRAKAKLLSLESRAEAASQMAETEIALKAFQDQSAGDPDPDLGKILELQQMSAAEFEKENFGGALYLTIQAKSRIQDLQTKILSSEKADLGRGETPFASPLTLKVTKASNVREQPDLGSSVLSKVGAGAVVTGYSHKGDWIRVVCADGTRGWIHQSLLSRD
jgi:SH3 domain-containing protein